MQTSASQPMNAGKCIKLCVNIKSMIRAAYGQGLVLFYITLHHHFNLQIAKINDPEKHGKDYNFSLAYFVAHVNKDSYTDSYKKFLEDNKEFIKSMKKARVKVVAHRDLGVFNSPDGVGAFPEGLDENYFNSLHEIISEGYKELGLDFFPEWPSFILGDTKIFMNKIEKTLKA